MTKIYNSIVEMVGHTPLLRLGNLTTKFKLNAEILAKCEMYNPLFSAVKGRKKKFFTDIFAAAAEAGPGNATPPRTGDEPSPSGPTARAATASITGRSPPAM